MKHIAIVSNNGWSAMYENGVFVRKVYLDELRSFVSLANKEEWLTVTKEDALNMIIGVKASWTCFEEYFVETGALRKEIDVSYFTFNCDDRNFKAPDTIAQVCEYLKENYDIDDMYSSRYRESGRKEVENFLQKQKFFC